MSEIKYGLISDTDARTLEKTIYLITKEMLGTGITETGINITEIGLYSGETSKALYEYATSKQYGGLSANPIDSLMQCFNFKCNYTGIDNNKDGEQIKHFPEDGKLIIGNSSEVYNQLEDESQHMIFQDANHSYPMTISDFFCYEKKVKKGGYYAIHDCGEHIAPKTSFQCMGSKDDEDMYISCRRAIKRIGLLDNKLEGWELVFDEADTENLMGGICVFRKI